MRDETYAKFLCHNICCLISAIYELGIAPVFPELNVAEVCPKINESASIMEGI